jgi:anti-sigma factor RsiW
MLLGNPYLMLAGGAAIVVAIGGSFLFGMDVGADRSYAAQKRTEQIIADTGAAAKLAAAEEIAKIKVVNRNTQQVLERETRIVPDYTHCRNSPDGLRAINGALEDRPVSPDSRVVPEADTTQRR